MRPRVRTMWVALGSSLALTLAACGTSSDNGEGDEPDDTPEPGRNTLEGVIPLEPPDLSPYTPPHAGKRPVFELASMLILLTDGDGEPFSYALESWEVSDDGHTVTLTIQPDIEWSDGTPLTSADIVMSLTQYLDPSLAAWSVNALNGQVVGQSAFADGEADGIAGLSAPDDRTVEVELEQPNGTSWLSSLSRTLSVILPEHVLGDVPHDELPDHEYFTNYDVTLGPYKFIDWASEQHFEFERSDTWSAGEAAFERVFIKFVTADVQTAQLETGESQIVSITPNDVDRVSSLDGVEIQSRLNPNFPAWFLRQYEPLDDKRVRQAMVYAIDREGICEEVLQGYCSVPLENTMVPSWARPDDLIEYNYDPERARELLDEAGWDPNTELTLLNPYPPDSDITNALTIAQGNMADVGINWAIENVDTAVMTERAEQVPGQLNGLVAAFFPESLDPSYMRPSYSCDVVYPKGNNFAHYCNEDLDELFDAAQEEGDQEELASIYQDAVRIVNEDVPVIELYQPEGIIAYDSRLKGVEAQPQIFGTYWNIGEWTWEE